MIKQTIQHFPNIRMQIGSFQPEGSEVREYHLLISGTNPALSFQVQVSQLENALCDWMKSPEAAGAEPLFKRFFLSDITNQQPFILQQEKGICPISIVQQPPLNGTKVALWCLFQTGLTTEVSSTGRLSAAHNGYCHHWCAGLQGDANNSEYQTRLLLESYVTQLMEQHCTLQANCLRTWFFVRDVDLNYAGVVKARKELFATQGLTAETHYIASTGIEGAPANPDSYVQMDGYAVEGIDPEQITYLKASSHLNPTYEYGVTFERGTAISYGDRKQIFLSGTASIDNTGAICFPGDVIQQTQRMMENIEALLQEAGASTKEVVQAITYLRDPADYVLVRNYFEQHYPDLPQLIVKAPVCRPGWLIETECIALTAQGDGRFRNY